jgi:hypothetical protein
MKIQIMVVWVLMLCSDVAGYHHFVGPYCLCFQGVILPLHVMICLKLHHTSAAGTYPIEVHV